MYLKLKNAIFLVLFSVFSVGGLWLTVGMSKIYQNFDGPYYVVVAKSWYDKVVIGTNFSFPLPGEYYAAHFPLYPAFIEAFSFTGLNYLQSMVAVNLVFGAGFAVVYYLILVKMKIKPAIWIAGAALFFWPRMWAVRAVGSPEMMFLFWVVLSLYFFSTKKYFWSGIFGGFAVATKSPGILLAVAYLGWWLTEMINKRKIEWRAIWVGIIPLTLIGVFYLFGVQTGDFWAYFNSGDNIHLQAFPFKVFDSNQSWVGNWWLEDVIWIYIISAVGVWRAFKKNQVFGWFGAVFLTALIFVSHRDISRYSLPLVPVVLMGLSEIWERKEVRWIAVIALIPMYFYSVNFLTHNVTLISDWKPLL